MTDRRLAETAARGILHGFKTYYARFEQIMARSKVRFEGRDWAGLQLDVDQRLTLYARAVDDTKAYVEDILSDRARDSAIWTKMCLAFEPLSEDPETGDLARAYFSTVKRRFIPMDASDFESNLVDIDPQPDTFVREVHVVERHPVATTDTNIELLRSILALYPFETPYVALEEDLAQAALLIGARLSEARGQHVVLLRPLFYRGRRAHIIGRIWGTERYMPLVISISHLEHGLRVHEVLLGSDQASSLFSFTRSQFHVVTAHHRELMAFLKSIAPAKSPADLYASVGYNNLAKSALLSDLFRLLKDGQRFRRATGINGTVMLAFELPGSRFVLKLIRDRFRARRVETTRAKVERRYQFVRYAERVGRILDVFHFHFARFDRAWFEEDLFDELLAFVPSNVIVEGERVILREFYAQRKVIPLDVFFRSGADTELTRRAAIDFGFLHKELATRNIFTGDVVPNNFGVVSPGEASMRVVSFDYDSYSRVTDMRFLRMPGSYDGDVADDDGDSSEERMVLDEEWDILPEKFRLTFGIPEAHREEFDRVHSELFDPAHWIALQREVAKKPEIVGAFPYPMIAR